MSLEIITMWRAEEMLAPFFLKHYGYANRITIFFTPDGPEDRTLDIIRPYPNVEVIEFRFPDNKLDDDLKISVVNRRYQETSCDWVLAVDADELVFLKDCDGKFIYDPRPFLKSQADFDLFFIRLYQIYRHRSEADPDIGLEVIPQRRHGDPNRFVGDLAEVYNKPALARAGLADFGWRVGCHNINRHLSTVRLSPDALWGAHWQLADPSWGVPRALFKNPENQSRTNVEKGATRVFKGMSADDVRALLARHENDPQLF